MQNDVSEQLFSSTLLRFWRTGAERHAYSAEDDGDIDVSGLEKFIIACQDNDI